MSVIENQGKKDEEPLSNEKMVELLRDESSITVPENKVVMQKPIVSPEEDKKVADKEFIMNSKRSHRGAAEPATAAPTPPASSQAQVAAEQKDESSSMSLYLLKNFVRK